MIDNDLQQSKSPTAKKPRGTTASHRVSRRISSQLNKHAKGRETDTWVTRSQAASLLAVSNTLFDRDVRPLIDAKDIQADPLRFRSGAVVAARMRQSQRITAGDSDPLLNGDSPALERYRNTKADLAEMDRDVRRGLLVPIDELEAVLMTYCASVRQAIERVQREFGNAPAEIINEALREWRANIEKLIAVYRDKQNSRANERGDVAAAPSLNA